MEQCSEKKYNLPEPTECIDEFKHKYRLVGEIARGGQGVVYRTQLPRIVVKLELDDNKQFVSANDDAKENFRSLRLLPIPPNLNITLPVAVTEKYSGYAMQLMDDMIPFSKAFSGAVDDVPLNNPWLNNIGEKNENLAQIFFKLIKRGGLRRIYRAYMKVASLLAGLHEAGLVYCDFSANNAFISSDIDFCNIWLIDADNLDYQKNTSRWRIWSDGVAAPEVFDENVGKGCTFFSDCHAFAATFFKQLTGHNPFEGKLFYDKVKELDDRKAAEYLRDCGKFPWVFDYNKTTNIWPIGKVFRNFISATVLDLFEDTFSAEIGLFKPENRPLMAEWGCTIAQSFDEIVRCPNCMMERFGSATTCPWCDHVHPLIEVTAYYKTGKVMWHFAHEAKVGESIIVPLRIFSGFHANEIDSEALIVKWTGHGLDVYKAKDDLSIEFADDKRERTGGSGFVTDEDALSIFCIDDKMLAQKIEVKLKNDT